MKVTSEILDIAAQAWEKQYGFNLVQAGARKAALQAVFDHIGDAEKRSVCRKIPTDYLKVMKEFADMAESQNYEYSIQDEIIPGSLVVSRKTFRLVGTLQYKALKALIDKSNSSEKPDSSEDGWIEWDGQTAPDPETIVDIKLQSGHISRSLISSSVAWWGVNSANTYYISSYRITNPKEERAIPEQPNNAVAARQSHTYFFPGIKEHKSNISLDSHTAHPDAMKHNHNLIPFSAPIEGLCKCINPIFSATDDDYTANYAICIKCGRPPNPSKPTPKKQTLLEYVKERYSDSEHSNYPLPIDALVKFISEYLEKYFPC